MRDICSTSDNKMDADLFKLSNNSKINDGVVSLDYSIRNFRVSRAISRQIDFITAHSRGSSQKNAETGVDLKFQHRLSRVELEVWGKNSRYDFEIAGVRLGNPSIEGNFFFCSGTKDGFWDLQGIRCGSVEYIYSAGEQIKSIADVNKENAVPVMGLGGPAMILPTACEAWNPKADPDIDKPGYSTDLMYLSLLVRAIVSDETIIDGIAKKQIYPAQGLLPEDQVNKITFAVNKESGIIKARLNTADGKYYDGNKKEYNPTPADEIKEFGWAAIPVKVDWKPGRMYVYTIDFSKGIGIRDPQDPHPGEPLLGGDVDFSVTFKEWDDSTPPEDIDVPSSTEDE